MFKERVMDHIPAMISLSPTSDVPAHEELVWG